MFKNGLLVTTALITVAALSVVSATGALARSSKQRDIVITHRNTNDEFLCTYGHFDFYYDRGGSSGSSYSEWVHVAVPITGNGRIVDRLIVKDGHPVERFSREFTIGLYSDSPSGFPGNTIVAGVGNANKKCKAVEVSIPRTKLELNKKYWIEETMPAPGWNRLYSLYWAINPNERRKAYIQSHELINGHSSTSPWTEMSTGPYFELK